MNKILFYYCFVFAFFLAAGGIATSKTYEQLLLQGIILPVPLFFLVSLIAGIRKKNMDSYAVKIKFLSKTSVFLFFLFLLFCSVSLYRILKNTQQPVKLRQTAKEQSVIPASPTTTPTPGPQYIVVSEDDNAKVNIRASASATATILQKAANNSTFPYVETIDNWYKIVLPDGSVGYISKDFSRASSEKKK